MLAVVAVAVLVTEEAAAVVAEAVTKTAAGRIVNGTVAAVADG